MEKWNQEAERIMIERFGKDIVIALVGGSGRNASRAVC